jgi:hypothetical protein
MTRDELKPTGLLTARQAAQWLGISERKLRSLGLRQVRIGRLVRYDRRDLELFADLNATRPALRKAGS